MISPARRQEYREGLAGAIGVRAGAYALSKDEADLRQSVTDYDRACRLLRELAGAGRPVAGRLDAGLRLLAISHWHLGGVLRARGLDLAIAEWEKALGILNALPPTADGKWFPPALRGVLAAAYAHRYQEYLQQRDTAACLTLCEKATRLAPHFLTADVSGSDLGSLQADLARMHLFRGGRLYRVEDVAMAVRLIQDLVVNAKPADKKVRAEWEKLLVLALARLESVARVARMEKEVALQRVRCQEGQLQPGDFLLVLKAYVVALVGAEPDCDEARLDELLREVATRGDYPVAKVYADAAELYAKGKKMPLAIRWQIKAIDAAEVKQKPLYQARLRLYQEGK